MTTIDTFTSPAQVEPPPLLHRSLILMKPITWFGPMWAFLCGAVASGATAWSVTDIGLVLIGMIMAGPILCGFSQVLNDYFDRGIDAINEPHRLIPSGLVSTKQIFVTLAALLLVGLLLGIYLGPGVILMVSLGIVLALIYSAPPMRAKRNGWIGNTLVALSYEGLAWMAGHLAFASLTPASILIALLYSLGAHGIMSINDYKGMAGDKAAGIRSIPVLYGPQKTAWIVVVTMNLAQIGVIVAFLYWGVWITALIISGILLAQLPQQQKFLQQPVENHIKFSAIGVSFYVWGMMVAAIGLRALL
ncbi:MAG TPA: chlorophyll synthase ChlG [Anaerolineae bacterium]|nr:chlorophyll synthase ChlG [Anaerolineae bacterium]